MKKTMLTTLVAVIIGSIATYWFTHSRQNEYQHNLLAKLLNVEKDLATTKNTLLGYTKFTDYISETKKAIEGQTKLLAAKVDREYVLVEHIQKGFLGFESEGTIIIKYAVEYSFGFDLRPDSFSISGDTNSITVTVSKPELVASPAVNILSHEIPSTGVLVDEKAAVIAVQQQLFATAKKKANEVRKDEAVIALCERRLTEFLRDFLSKQPGVKTVPAITVVYKT